MVDSCSCMGEEGRRGEDAGVGEVPLAEAGVAADGAGFIVR